VGLYWDLVSFNDSLKVKQRTLELNTSLYADNKRRAELGALAEIDIIQAEAEMKSSQRDVTTAETQVLQQEMILKSVLTRSGVSNSAIITAHIVPTDHFDMPAQESVQPTQDLVSEAFRNGLKSNRARLTRRADQVRAPRTTPLPAQRVRESSNNGLAGLCEHAAHSVVAGHRS
jgi:outer membrane protein TolC